MTATTRAYLPMTSSSRTYAAILNADTRLPQGSVRFARDENPPAGCSPTAWDVLTDDAMAYFAKAKAIIVSKP